jgi:hypothetical protein
MEIVQKDPRNDPEMKNRMLESRKSQLKVIHRMVESTLKMPEIVLSDEDIMASVVSLQEAIKTLLNYRFKDSIKGEVTVEKMDLQQQEEMKKRKEESETHCKDVEETYRVCAKEIEASDNKEMKEYLESHINVVENRSGFKLCQKTPRRKILIDMWTKVKEKNF